MKTTDNDSEKAETNFTDMAEVFNKTNKLRYSMKKNHLKKFLNLTGISDQRRYLAYIG